MEGCGNVGLENNQFFDIFVMIIISDLYVSVLSGPQLKNSSV